VRGHHIRNERTTREAMLAAGTISSREQDLPTLWCISWCSERVSGEWFFQSIDHAALSATGAIVACPRCLQTIVEALKKVRA
jgi:hypothetical protein